MRGPSRVRRFPVNGGRMSELKERTWEVGEKLWQEDDATLQDPTAEKVNAAWVRLFGEHLPASLGCPSYNGGDFFRFLMPNGATLEQTLHGAAIYAPVGGLKVPTPARQKTRVRKWYVDGLSDLSCGMTLAEIRDEAAKMIEEHGPDLILDVSASSCGNCDNEDIEVDAYWWVERDETDSEYAERVARLTKQREQQEQRERAEYTRLVAKFGGAK